MNELELAAVTVQVGGRALVDRVSLALGSGDFVALIGPNGAGKTTLIRAAIGLVRPNAGHVYSRGTRVSELAARERAARMAWLPQHVRADEPLSALDAVAAARFRFSETYADSCRAAHRALERVRAERHAEQSILSLSGGERQRVAFACLMAQDASTLLFDEPGNHLDPAQQLDVYGLLDSAWQDGKTVLCVSHDVNLLRFLHDVSRIRVIGLAAGRVHFETRFTAPELPEQMSRLFGVEMAVLTADAARLIVPRRRTA
ncbi:MAG TPA: ABC transporter ATP-binding protein [Polyangiaceae bacterium]|jgi:iron complex transport system ATP-binding protein